MKEFKFKEEGGPSTFKRVLQTAFMFEKQKMEEERKRANRLTQSINDEVRSSVMATITFGWHLKKVMVKGSVIIVVYQDMFGTNQLVQRYVPEEVITWRKQDKTITKDSKYYQKGEDL